MARSNPNAELRNANFRLCHLCNWNNYSGLGFKLLPEEKAPYTVAMVESNSPALAGGLRILDVILKVNDKDMTKAKYQDVNNAIKNAMQNGGGVDLLVVGKNEYEKIKKEIPKLKKQDINEIRTPPQMPRDYANFVKNKPRTCIINLEQNPSLGIELSSGVSDFGTYVLAVTPNGAAEKAGVRSSDRIVEINDEFVDNETYDVIKGKLRDAIQSGTVKLYVFDTSAYEYYTKSRLPLESNDQEESTGDSDNETGNIFSTGYAGVPTKKPTITSQSNVSTVSHRSTGQVPNDIRLCSITRANPTDSYGFEHNFKKRERHHILKLAPARDGEQTNAERAGIKSEDHLIEINDANVEELNDTTVKRMIKDNRYPIPLKLLVADSQTYQYYKRQNQKIHSGLVKSRPVPKNVLGQLVKPQPLSISRDSRSSTASTVQSLATGRRPAPGIAGLVTNNPLQPRSAGQDLSPGSQERRLQRIPGFEGYGFSVSTDLTSSSRHKINQITPGSPAAVFGLNVNDVIRKVNGHNVEDKNSDELTQLLKRETKKSTDTGEPIVLEVVQQESSTRLSSTSLRSSISTTEARTPVKEIFPELRLCNIRAWPDNSNLGFQVAQTRNTYGEDAYRIRQLQPNSAAAHTNLRNDDYIIEVNGTKIESEDDDPIQDLIENAYRRNKRVELLVIDDYGYQWYKQKLKKIDRSSAKANVKRYTTPDPPIITPPVPSRPSTAVNNASIRSRDNRSRGAIDVVTEKRLLRFCRLSTTPGQPFGFQLQPNEERHIVCNIEPNSAASRAGLNNNDRLVEVENENVERRSSKDVAGLIRNASHNGVLRLFVTPNGIKALTKQSAKSLSALNNDNLYRSSSVRSTTDDPYPRSLTEKSRSLSRLYREKSPHDVLDTVYDHIDQTAEPTEPWPRKCVLLRDSSYDGCGFRLVEKETYDTPIVLEVLPKSPAKRSGLSEGDHIIYVDSQNVQNFRSFNEITRLIKRIFEENGQVTLVTITGPGYQVLKRDGGYLDSTVFDYQSARIDQMRPRLCSLHLSYDDDDFGLKLQRSGFLYVDRIEQGSPADSQGLRTDDVILELNGVPTKYLSTLRIKEIIEVSKQEGKLDVLVIDDAGYQFSVKHAIPLNSLLAFVQKRDVRAPSVNSRAQNEPIYL